MTVSTESNISPLMERRLGEVVVSSSTSLVAQCYQLEGAPALGALVRTDLPEIYGVVGTVTTEPLDSARPVLARGEESVSEEDIIRDNPQLARLLTSRFEVFIAGFVDKSAVRQYLPPRPPRVHSFIYSCPYLYMLNHLLHLIQLRSMMKIMALIILLSRLMIAIILIY